MSGFHLKDRIVQAILDGGNQYYANEREQKVREAEDQINRMTNVELLDAIDDALVQKERGL